MTNKRLDIFLATIFGIGIIVFLYFVLGYEEFQMWAFTRHQNPLSWYIRPLFLLPLCFFAYNRSLAGIFGTILALLTSMIWFDPPSSLNPQAQAFLDMELAYLTRKWDNMTKFMSLFVPITLFLLVYAYWRRNLWFSMVILGQMILTKVVWDFFYGNEMGNSYLLLAVLGVLLWVSIAYFGKRKMESKKISLDDDRTVS